MKSAMPRGESPRNRIVTVSRFGSAGRRMGGGQSKKVRNALTRELSRRERKKLEIYQRIRRAAARLFAEKGYEATTVDEITELADVGKGTFFNYFPRKDALLVELAEEMMEDVEEALGPRETWEGTAPEKLTRFFLEFGNRIQRDPELFKVMIVENMRSFWMKSGEDSRQTEFRMTLRSLLEEGRDRGEFPEDVPIDSAVKLIEASYVTSIIETLKCGGSPEDYRNELIAKFNVIFRGLGAEPVREEGVGR